MCVNNQQYEHTNPYIALTNLKTNESVAYTVSVTVQSPAVPSSNIEGDPEYIRKPVKDLRKQFSKQPGKPGRSRKGRRSPSSARTQELYSDEEPEKPMICEL